ncbi:MAG: FecR domain-containing protein [Proteobacteria bacterium]|nr:FecR domain-containing protein [Pseudomonadota bacterium]MBU0968333.1 FecR domain-containing protein [Pseudomonadota bacterium]
MKKRSCLPTQYFSSFFALLILLLLLPLAVQAGEEPGQEAAATVVACRGNVQAINSNGEMRKLVVKSPIHTEDTIKTAKGGRIQILFTDNTIYSLGQSSEMKIAEYRWQPEEKNGSLKTKIKEGVFRVMGGAITKTSPQNFTTETPAATIGIRGSMYAGTVTPTSLAVVFQGGKGINVTNPFGTVAISRPGHGTNVTMNSAPEAPRQLSEQDLAAFSNELTAAGEGDEDQATGTVEEGSNDEAAAQDEQAVDGSEDEGAAQPAAEPAADETAVDEQVSDQADTATIADIAPVTTDTTVDTPVIELPPPNELAPVIDTSPAATTVPTDGISSYFGTLTGTATNADGTTSTINDELWMEVNWHSGKVLGRIKGQPGEPPVFFIGKVSGNQITNVRILGSNLETPDGTLGQVTALYGSASGTLGGTALDLFNFTGSGNAYEIEPFNQPLHDSWTIQGTGTKEPQDPADVTSPKGVKTWKGYVVGVSENMASINSDRRLFMNSSPGDFSFTVDKDNGTLSGSLSAIDMNGSNARLVKIGLGGALASAFVLEDNFAAELGCATGDCITSGAATPTGLKKYGNYLISADPHVNTISDYVTWGYWEIAYRDPASGAQYHTHVPGSRWIAGEPTSVAEVNELVSTSFTGHYSGTAYASKIDPTAAKQVTDLQGTVEIDVDFGNLNAASAVQGVIKLDGMDLYVNSGPAGNASAGGFSNNVYGVTGPAGIMSNGTFNGAFYGPKAKSIAGNFYAPFSSGKSYIGIYGGTR